MCGLQLDYLSAKIGYDRCCHTDPLYQFIYVEDLAQHLSHEWPLYFFPTMMVQEMKINQG